MQTPQFWDLRGSGGTRAMSWMKEGTYVHRFLSRQGFGQQRWWQTSVLPVVLLVWRTLVNHWHQSEWQRFILEHIVPLPKPLSIKMAAYGQVTSKAQRLLLWCLEILIWRPSVWLRGKVCHLDILRSVRFSLSVYIWNRYILLMDSVLLAKLFAVLICLHGFLTQLQDALRCVLPSCMLI